MAIQNPRPTFNHGDREARARKAVERIGDPNAKCLICGEPSAQCLEQHHPAGRKFHDETFPLCRNHHSKVSDLQKDHPQCQCDEPNVFEVWGRFCLGLGDILIVVVEENRAPNLSDLFHYIIRILNWIGRNLINVAHGIEPQPLEVRS